VGRVCRTQLRLPNLFSASVRLHVLSPQNKEMPEGIAIRENADRRDFLTRSWRRYPMGTDYVKPVLHSIARALFRAGGLGLLTLGALDSSPLVVPMGNDLLVLALSARYHERVPYYVVMATAGSLIGCFATDWISRKSESGQKKFVSSKHLDYIRKLVEKRAGWTLVMASLMPPPFPFTVFVAAAAAFRYSRIKLLSFVGLGRFVRFVIEGALAIKYGRWIIKQAESPLLEHVMIALIVISIGGSVFSIYRWTKRQKE
jgi:membrane protein YqaA with SNARE-associated domain